VLRHAATLPAARQGVRVCVLSARVGSIGTTRIGGLDQLSRAKAALNQIVAHVRD